MILICLLLHLSCAEIPERDMLPSESYLQRWTIKVTLNRRFGRFAR